MATLFWIFATFLSVSVPTAQQSIGPASTVTSDIVTTSYDDRQTTLVTSEVEQTTQGAAQTTQGAAQTALNNTYSHTSDTSTTTSHYSESTSLPAADQTKTGSLPYEKACPYLLQAVVGGAIVMMVCPSLILCFICYRKSRYSSKKSLNHLTDHVRRRLRNRNSGEDDERYAMVDLVAAAPVADTRNTDPIRKCLEVDIENMEDSPPLEGSWSMPAGFSNSIYFSSTSRSDTFTNRTFRKSITEEHSSPAAKEESQGEANIYTALTRPSTSHLYSTIDQLKSEGAKETASGEETVSGEETGGAKGSEGAKETVCGGEIASGGETASGGQRVGGEETNKAMSEAEEMSGKGDDVDPNISNDAGEILADLPVVQICLPNQI